MNSAQPSLEHSSDSGQTDVADETQALLRRSASAAAALLPASVAFISRQEGEQEVVVAAAGVDEQSDAIRNLAAAAADSISNGRGEHAPNEPVVITDARRVTSDVLAAPLIAANVISLIAVPVVSRLKERTGTLVVADSLPRRWAAAEIRALQDLAALAAVALGDAARDRTTPETPALPEQGLDVGLARLRRSFDDGLAGHAVAAADGRILACNAEFARIAGFRTIQEAMAANLHSLEPKPGAFVPLLERLKESASIPLEELKFVRRDGTPAQVLVRLAATLDAGGEVTEVRVYLVDITKRFLDEQALRRKAEQLSLVQLATQDVLWDWDLTSGKWVWSGAIARRFRYTPEEVHASTDWLIELIHPEDRERVLRSFERAVLGIENAWSDEYRILRGDGSYANVLNRAHIARNDRGEPVRVVGAILDITELKKSEDSQRFLAHASAALESALEVDATTTTLAHVGVPALADFCMVDLLDPEGKLRRVAVAHAQPHRESNLGLGQVRPAKLDTSRVVAWRGSSAEPADQGALDTLGITAEAGMRSYVVVPLTVRERVLGAAIFGLTNTRQFGPLELMTVKDLTQRAARAIDNALLYEAARRAVRSRNEVLGIVSHDLRVPVNTMLATLDLLADSMRERREEIRKWFDVLCRATTQMRNLIEDLLDASRMESEQFTIDRSLESLGSIIAEACDMLRPLAAAKEIAIEMSVPEDLAPVCIDAPKIVRVVGNLVGNAIKFSPHKRSIHVLAERGAGELRVAVRDEGKGIPADQLGRVFDRFWSGRSHDRRGAGLGLAIAKGIVEAHGGRIWVESQEEKGSTFTFAIPIGDGQVVEGPAGVVAANSEGEAAACGVEIDR
ncbi:MAG TPA: ATP-binding protein [Longimicrobiales bacterium]|nr:ATP-binding protein [Longimicrobiales bacterium]